MTTFNFELNFVQRIHLPMQETWVKSLGWDDLLGKRKWQPTPVFLPGKSHKQRSHEGYHP